MALVVNNFLQAAEFIRILLCTQFEQFQMAERAAQA
jgi:hypothetical protein